jgi:cell division control protein 6
LEKFLPKLKAKGHEPLSINFLPYKVEELIDILKFKCKDLAYKDPEGNDQALVNPKAIEFCSRKVASDTGDLRRALDLLLQVVDYTQDQFESSNNTELIQVDIAQVLSVTKLLNQNSLNNKLKAVNISQKLILISLIHNLKLNQIVKFDDVSYNIS